MPPPAPASSRFSPTGMLPLETGPPPRNSDSPPCSLPGSHGIDREDRDTPSPAWILTSPRSESAGAVQHHQKRYPGVCASSAVARVRSCRASSVDPWLMRRSCSASPVPRSPTQARHYKNLGFPRKASRSQGAGILLTRQKTIESRLLPEVFDGSTGDPREAVSWSSFRATPSRVHGVRSPARGGGGHGGKGGKIRSVLIRIKNEPRQQPGVGTGKTGLTMDPRSEAFPGQCLRRMLTRFARGMDHRARLSRDETARAHVPDLAQRATSIALRYRAQPQQGTPLVPGSKIVAAYWSGGGRREALPGSFLPPTWLPGP